MVIKYKCFDRSTKSWRKPDPKNMVSMFTPDKNNAMRIVAPQGYVLVIYTGFSDSRGNDVYPGDILDDERYIKWEILEGRWGAFDKKGKCKTLAEYPPGSHTVTGSVLQSEHWPDLESEQ